MPDQPSTFGPSTIGPGIQTGVGVGADHAPGSIDPDDAGAQVPRVASGGVGAGDVAHAQGDEPVLGARSADARFEAGDPQGDPRGGMGGASPDPLKGSPLPEPDERPPLAMRQPVQQQQAQVAAGPSGPSTSTSSGTIRTAQPGPQEGAIEGPGYPTEDMDDVDEEDDGLLSDDDDDDDEEGDEFAEVEEIDDDVQMMAPPELGDAPIEEEEGDTSILGDGHADKAAWNRERVAAMQEDEEEAPGEDTFGSQEVIGHGHAPDVLPVDPLSTARQPGSSEDMGYGGGAPNEDVDVPGLGTGDGRLDELTEDTDADAQDQLEDATDALDDPPEGDVARAPGRQARARDPLVEGQFERASPGTGHGAPGVLAGRGGEDDPEHGRPVALGDEVGAFRDDSMVLTDGTPFLPEHRNFREGELDDDIPLEERLLDGGGEDPSFALGEVGFAEDLEMEELNETDDISNRFEDQRVADDSADGNEERTWRRD